MAPVKRNQVKILSIAFISMFAILVALCRDDLSPNLEGVGRNIGERSKSGLTTLEVILAKIEGEKDEVS